MGARSGPVPAGSNGLFVVFSMTDPFLALYCNKTAGQCLSHVGTEGNALPRLCSESEQNTPQSSFEGTKSGVFDERSDKTCSGQDSLI